MADTPLSHCRPEPILAGGLTTDTAQQQKAGRLGVILSLAFRPFFLLGAVFAVVSMLLWLALLHGIGGQSTATDPVLWHAHEMLFGFAGAAIAGFLLTAVATWTGRPPVTGKYAGGAGRGLDRWPRGHGFRSGVARPGRGDRGPRLSCAAGRARRAGDRCRRQPPELRYCGRDGRVCRTRRRLSPWAVRYLAGRRAGGAFPDGPRNPCTDHRYRRSHRSPLYRQLDAASWPARVRRSPEPGWKS